MNHTRIASQPQAHIHVQSKIDDFFGRFQIATLMHCCGVRKHHGHSVRSLTEAIFTLPFVGKNFFRGIVLNSELSFGKDAAYELLKGETYNWRRLLLSLGRRLFGVFHRLTSEERESVLIIDDSPYDRSRSKWVELLASVWDHSTGRFLKGFRMLTICWSDGVSCLPMDFALLSSVDPKKRLCDSQKVLDKRCCAYQRRKEELETLAAQVVTPQASYWMTRIALTCMAWLKYRPSMSSEPMSPTTGGQQYTDGHTDHQRPLTRNRYAPLAESQP